MTQHNKRILCIFLAVALLVAGSFWALRSGAKDMDFQTMLAAFVQRQDILEHQLLLDVRLPRMLCTILVGGLLGLCGAMMQGVTRNPIAEPSILGISQGATLAISVLYINTAWMTSTNIVLASLTGALFSGLLIIFFSCRGAGNLAMGKLLLAGTALSTFFLSLSSVIGILSNHSQMIGFLVGGGFQNTSWNHVLLLVVTTIPGVIAAMLLATKINAVSLGDDVCIALGEQPNQIRIYTLLLIILLSAICVAVAKNIVFVGLIIPQIVKRMMKHDYRHILPIAFLTGSVLLVYSDILARTLLRPYEVPIGIFTSLLGIPFFLYLVKKERG